MTTIKLPHDALLRATTAYAATRGTHQQKLEAALVAAQPAPVLPFFELAVEFFDRENPSATPSQRAAFASWWFIENVTDDTPDRSDVYFAVREIVRAQ